MDYEDIIKLPLRAKISRFKVKSLKSELIKRTSFLPENSGIGERIYCLDNNINEIVYCYCGNPVKYLKYSEGYSKRCSKKCVYLDQSVSEKRKNTCLDKYGVDSFTKTKSYLEKTKQTNLEKYGEDFYLQTEIKKEKTKQTNLEKYGAEHHMKSSIFIGKFKENNIKIFGVDNVSKLDDVKLKKKSTFQKNYGIDHIFSSNVLKGIYFKEKYGYDPYLPNELKGEFKKYKDEVWRITNRHKRELIFNWSGYDYYDNLYIKENYKLNYNDNSYPSIDHKISIYDGYINKIDPFIIGDMNNLCITKRSINRNKGVLSEDVFKDLWI